MNERKRYRKQLFVRENMQASAVAAVGVLVAAVVLLFGRFRVLAMPMRALDIIMIIASIAVLTFGMLFSYGGDENTGFASALTYCFVSLTLLFGVMHSLEQSRAGGSVLWFFVVTAVIAGLFALSPVYMAVAMLISALVLIRFLQPAEGGSKERAIALALFCVFVWLMVLYRFAKKNREAVEGYERMRQDNAFRTLSVRDELTGAYNRVGLRLSYDEYAGSDIMVMMVDIDGFTEYNEEYGQISGDAVLRGLARTLIKEFDDMCCYRYGADEFLIVSYEDDVDLFEDKIKACMKRLSELDLERADEVPTISCGVVYGRCEMGTGLRQMMRASREVLSRAQAKGGNTFETADIDSIDLSPEDEDENA